MNAKAFVDTNVLIYAYDVDAGSKHEIARSLLRELWSERSAVLSTQVLQEFYVNITRKISSPLSKPAARALISSYASWNVGTRFEDLTLAFQIEDQSQIRFWDALILASAVRVGASRLLSEDLNSGQTIMGIRIQNPFQSES